jgi:hypothetical protein
MQADVEGRTVRSSDSRRCGIRINVRIEKNEQDPNDSGNYQQGPGLLIIPVCLVSAAARATLDTGKHPAIRHHPPILPEGKH